MGFKNEIDLVGTVVRGLAAHTVEQVWVWPVTFLDLLIILLF